MTVIDGRSRLALRKKSLGGLIMSPWASHAATVLQGLTTGCFCYKNMHDTKSKSWRRIGCHGQKSQVVLVAELQWPMRG